MAELVGNIIEGIPIRDNYKRMHDDYVLLKGPPNVTRACFLFEIAVAAAAFAVSFYISITSLTSTTTITFEPLGSSYECELLSPRSDSKEYSATTSELVMFSSARLLLDDCLDILDTDGLNVCSDGNRNDAVLSVQGVTAGENCFDLLLPNDYRFCYGSEGNLQLTKQLDKTYPRQTEGAPALTYENVFYFMNASGIIHAVLAPFTKDDLLSQYYQDNGAIYVVATSNTEHANFMYKIALENNEVEQMFKINSDNIAGVAASSGVAYALEFNTNMVTLYAYDEGARVVSRQEYICTTGTTDSSTVYQLLAVGTDGYIYILCTPTVDTNTATEILRVEIASMQVHTLRSYLGAVEREGTSGGAVAYINNVNSIIVIDKYAYIATGSTDFNLLRVNLTDADTTNAPTLTPTIAPTPLPGASFAPTAAGSGPPPPGGRRLAGPVDGVLDESDEATRRLVVNTLTNALVQAAGLEGTATAAALHELIHRSAQLSAAHTPHYDTFAASESRESVALVPSTQHTRRLAASDHLPVENLGTYEGAYMHRVDDSFIYFQDGNSSYFDPESQQFGVYTDHPGSYYLATAVQLAYSFGICDGVVVSNWTITTGSSSGFFDQCDDINGIYYQNNVFFDVPPSCAGHFNSAQEVSLETLSTCPDLEAIFLNFTTTNCADSFTKICQAEYTDNPPYSCTDSEAPDFFTTLGSALANASALWSFTAIAISLLLKRTYPGGISLRKYKDENESKKLSKGGSAAVHPVDDGGERADGLDKPI